MKIATFNINNVRRRLPNLLDWLRTASPDVVCLQELKTADRQFPADAIRRAGYEAVWQGQASWNGVAILARGATPIVTRTALPGDPPDTQSRYLEAAINGVLVGCFYAPNGNPKPGPKFDYKLAWMKRFNRHAASLFKAGLPVVLAGDINVVPTDRDIYRTNSYDDDALLQPEPRALYRRLLAQGWTDAIRTLHPDSPMFSFWDYMRKRWERDAGLRLDQILLSTALAKRLVAAGVDRTVRGKADASDHAPVWAKLRDPGTRSSAKRKPAPRRSLRARRRHRDSGRCSSSTATRLRIAPTTRCQKPSCAVMANRLARFSALPTFCFGSIRPSSRGRCWSAGTRSTSRRTGTSNSPIIKAAATSTTRLSNSSMCCQNSWRPAAL